MDVPSRQELDAGTEIDAYRIERKLGRGATGTVYAARDTRLDRTVALKILEPLLAADPDLRARFLREAQAAARLMHDNAATVFGAGETADHLYIAMQLVEGQTLSSMLDASGPLPLHRAIELGAQLASAVAAAHDEGLLHRDLKPENLMVTQRGKLVVLDFGLAKLLDAQHERDAVASTAAGQIIGTPGYIPPERIAGGDADQRGDVFAIGCILFEMLAGRRAFLGDTPLAVIVAETQDEVPSVGDLRAEVPASVADLIARCVRRNPDERPSSVRTIADLLSAVDLEPLRRVSNAPTILPSDTVPLDVGATSRRSAAVLFVVVLIGVALGLVWMQYEERAPAATPGLRPLVVKGLDLLRTTSPQIAFSPDGDKIAVMTAAGALRVVRTDGTHVATAEPEARWRIDGFGWSADGTWLGVNEHRAEDARSRARAFEPQRSSWRDLVPSGRVAALAPDGARMLVVAGRDAVVTDPTGAVHHRLDAGRLLQATWGTSSNRLLLGLDDGADGAAMAIVAVDLETDERTTVYKGPDTLLPMGNLAFTEISGGRIAYARSSPDASSGSEIRLATPNGDGTYEHRSLATLAGRSVSALERVVIDGEEHLRLGSARITMEVRHGEISTGPVPTLQLGAAQSTLFFDRVSDWSADGKELWFTSLRHGRFVALRTTSHGPKNLFGDDPRTTHSTWPVAVDADRMLVWKLRSSSATVARASMFVVRDDGRVERELDRLAHLGPLRAAGRPPPMIRSVACAPGVPSTCFSAVVLGDRVEVRRIDVETGGLSAPRELRGVQTFGAIDLAVRREVPRVALAISDGLYVERGEHELERVALRGLSPSEFVQYLDWVPGRDGLIATVLHPSGVARLAVIDLDGTVQCFEPLDAGWACCPRMAPDGQRFAFSQMIGSPELAEIAVPPP